VLPGPGFGYDPLLSHPLCQEPLADGVVHLVGAGMVQIFPFQIYLCAAKLFRQFFGKIEWIRPTDILFQVIGQLRLERRIAFVFFIGLLQFQQSRHKCLGNISAAELAKVTVFVRIIH